MNILTKKVVETCLIGGCAFVAMDVSFCIGKGYMLGIIRKLFPEVENVIDEAKDHMTRKKGYRKLMGELTFAMSDIVKG